MNRILFGALVLCAGCATSAGGDLNAVVKNKAAFDLACPADQVTVSELSGGQAMTNGFAASNQKSFGADGCGKRASYFAWCTNMPMMGGENCQAMQSGAPVASPNAAAAPAAAPAAPPAAAPAAPAPAAPAAAPAK